jgi:hypothetical protein
MVGLSWNDALYNRIIGKANAIQQFVSILEKETVTNVYFSNYIYKAKTCHLTRITVYL